MPKERDRTEPKSANITIAWDNTHSRTVLCYHFVGMWEWYEFSQASTRAFRMMAEVSHDVSVVFDFRLSLDIPIGALRAVRRLLNYAPANMDIIVIASDDKLTQQTFVMLLRLDKSLRKHITFAKSPEDALTLLKQHNAQIN